MCITLLKVKALKGLQNPEGTDDLYGVQRNVSNHAAVLQQVLQNITNIDKTIKGGEHATFHQALAKNISQLDKVYVIGMNIKWKALAFPSYDVL